MRGNERWTRPKLVASVVLTVLAGLGHRQGALAPFLVGIKGPPRRRRPARCERAGNARIALDRVSRGARGDLFARDSVRVARAMAVTPAHQIDVEGAEGITVGTRRRHRAELMAGGGRHAGRKPLSL